MRKMFVGMLLLFPLTIAVLLGVVLSGNVQGTAVVVDKSNITYTPAEPYHSDTFNVTVDPLFVDAEPVEDGVLLMWSLCTDEGCGIANPRIMNDNGDGTWSTELDSFLEENSEGEPYIKILMYVKIIYTPMGGGEEATEQTDSLDVYFKKTIPVDDDDDDTTPVDDDDDDGDDSPFGFELVIAGVILTVAFVVYRKKSSQD